MNDWLEQAWLWVVAHPWLSLGLFAATSAGVTVGLVLR